MSERRRERRSSIEIPVRVWGTDVIGTPFSQTATASEISNNGGLLTGLQSAPRAGDLIGIDYDGRRGRFRVVWARGDRAAVQRSSDQQCPWAELISKRSLKGQGTSTPLDAVRESSRSARDDS